MPEYRSQQSNYRLRSGAGRIASALGLFTLCFWATAALINSEITQKHWQPDLGQYSSRLAAVAQHKDELTDVFVGSSHINNGIYPIAFNRVMNAGGISTSAFNLSNFGPTIPLQLHTLRQLQQLQPARLRHVYLEPILTVIPVSPFNPDAYENLFSTRNRYFYDSANSRRMTALRWQSDRPLMERALGVFLIQAAYLIHASNLGVMGDLWLYRTPPEDTSYELWSLRGYGFPQNPQVTNKPLDRLNLEDGYREIMPLEQDILAELIALIEATGARPVLLFPPARKAIGKQRAVRDEILQLFPHVAVMDYTADTNPISLYSDQSLWADVDHLARSGAVKFSEQVAQDRMKLQPTPAVPEQ